MRALAADASLHGVMEPDNESRSAPAIWAKRRAGRFPVLEPGDQDPGYRRLWEWILAGADQSPRLTVAATTLPRRPGRRSTALLSRTILTAHATGRGHRCSSRCAHRPHRSPTNACW